MSRGHHHNATAGTQNQGNSLGDRSSVRQSKLFRQHESGNTMKGLLGTSHLSWRTDQTEGAYAGKAAFDHMNPDHYSPPRRMDRRDEPTAPAGEWGQSRPPEHYHRSDRERALRAVAEERVRAAVAAARAGHAGDDDGYAVVRYSRAAVPGPGHAYRTEQHHQQQGYQQHARGPSTRPW